MSFNLPQFHEKKKNPEIPLDVSAQEKSKAITLYYDPSDRLFSGAFLFLPANIAVFQI